MTGIVLATDSAEFEARVREAFNGSLNGDLRRFGPHLEPGATGGSIGDLAAGDPDVIAVGPGPSIERILETVRVLDRERPEIAVVIVADPTARLWEQALRAGARDVIAPEAPATDVREALERARETCHRRRSIGGSDEPQEASHRVIAVLSPKGGSGKTTMATNLAVGLARSAPSASAPTRVRAPWPLARTTNCSSNGAASKPPLNFASAASNATRWRARRANWSALTDCAKPVIAAWKKPAYKTISSARPATPNAGFASCNGAHGTSPPQCVLTSAKTSKRRLLQAKAQSRSAKK